VSARLGKAIIFHDMPVVPFETLPPSARVWVFASDRVVSGEQAELLLGTVDAYLATWRAHNQPLTVARLWRDDRFLAIGVDQTDAYASGCSIDGLFRTLQSMQSAIGASLIGGGRVHYRDSTGVVRTVSREEFSAVGEPGTRVFDPTVGTVGEWRGRFETDAANSWHAALLPVSR
jgi:hypothetical protein